MHHYLEKKEGNKAKNVVSEIYNAGVQEGCFYSGCSKRLKWVI